MIETPRKIFSCFLFFVILCGGPLFSQTPVLPYDSSYIDRYPSKNSVRIYTAQKQNHLYLFHKKWNDRIELAPQQKFAAGLGYGVKGFGIDLGVAVYRDNTFPGLKTKGFNFISSLYRGRNSIDMIFEINRGFAEKGDSAGKSFSLVRNDINEFNFGVNYNYLFNYRKFSFNAALSGTQIQKKSAGSFFLGGFLADMNLMGDSALISSKFSSLFDPGDVGSQVNVFTLGVTGGYAYTLVLPHRFYITASLIPGISFSVEQNEQDSITLLSILSAIGPKIISREAIGYAGKKFYVLGFYTVDINGTSLKNNNYLFYAPEKMKLIFGYRLK